MAANPDSLSFQAKSSVEKTRLSASQALCWDWLFRKRVDFFFSTSSLLLSSSLSVCLSLPGDQDQLHVATAARLVLLRLDVVVYLELGLIGLLCRSVLQIPDGERDRGS